MKYMGSKARIVDKILPIMLDNSDCSCFVDMFCGGCSVIQRVPKSYKRIANDANPFLVSMWRFLVETNLEFPMHISRESYAFWRNIYNGRKKLPFGCTSDDAMIGWVGFMGSYNGRFFDGGYSGHEVKIKGGVRDYIGENIRNTLSQVEDLKGVDFRCSQYMDFDFEEKCIIYCDPPYKGVKKYSYSIDHDYFWNWCRKQVELGHKVFVSEYQAPEDFVCVWEQGLSTTMHQTITKKPIERLFIQKSQVKL